MNSVVLKSESVQDASNQVAISEQRERENEEERKRAEEETSRRRAEEEARKRAEEETARKKAEEEAARKRAEEEAARKRAEEEGARKKAEEAARKRAEEEEAARKKAEEEASRIRAEEEEAARVKAEEEASRMRAEEEETARESQNVSHPMLDNVSDSESECYEEATIVNNTQTFQFIHLPPPPVQPMSRQSSYRSPAPHSTPPSPPVEKEKGFIDKLLMNLRIRSGYHV